MNKPILALTLWQPWASLIAWGMKHFETRSWGTSYRGKLVIHASVTRDELKVIDEFLVWWKGSLVPDDGDFAARVAQAMAAHGLARTNELPMGAGVCVCDLVDCIQMTEAFIGGLTAQERLFGWYEPGRWAWKLANVRVFEQPIPARGAQKM